MASPQNMLMVYLFSHPSVSDACIRHLTRLESNQFLMPLPTESITFNFVYYTCALMAGGVTVSDQPMFWFPGGNLKLVLT